MIALRGLVLAAFVAAGLAACASEAAPSVVRVSHPVTLSGTTWTLVSIQDRRPPVGPDVTVTFGPTDVSGDGGCNSYGGAYRYDPTNGALAIGDLVSTKRACVEPARNDLETAFFQALRGASAVSVDPDGRLVVTGSGAELVLAVGPQPGGPPVLPPASTAP